jgi:hypothetical protein
LDLNQWSIKHQTAVWSHLTWLWDTCSNQPLTTRAHTTNYPLLGKVELNPSSL